MIYDTIDHAGLYRPISANLAKALDLLASTDLSKYDTERVEIDGDKVYALFQRYETKPVNDSPEAHKKYIDLQYLIDGEEFIGVAPLSTMKKEVEARTEGDIYFYEGETVKLYEADIRYVESFLHYIVIHTKDKEYKIKENISVFESRVSDDFYRIHRSYLVALKHITRISRTSVNIGNTELPLSRGKYDDINRAFIEHN